MYCLRFTASNVFLSIFYHFFILPIDLIYNRFSIYTHIFCTSKLFHIHTKNIKKLYQNNSFFAFLPYICVHAHFSCIILIQLKFFKKNLQKTIDILKIVCYTVNVNKANAFLIQFNFHSKKVKKFLKFFQKTY